MLLIYTSIASYSCVRVSPDILIELALPRVAPAKSFTLVNPNLPNSLEICVNLKIQLYIHIHINGNIKNYCEIFTLKCHFLIRWI